MFKKIMLCLFWVSAPLNRELSVIKKFLIVLEISLRLIVMIWAFTIILLLPAWFSEKHVINGHIIYANNNVNSELLQNILDITNERMKKTGIDGSESLLTIYLHNNDILFSLSAIRFPSNVKAVHEGIIFKRMHVSLNEEGIHINGIPNQDWLSIIITHERIHNLQYKRYGILTYTLFIPEWVKEGYAGYISRGRVPSDKDYEEWLRRINAGENINKHFEYSILVRHAIDKMGYSPDELHNDEVDHEMVKKSLLIWVEKELKQAVKNA
ncbi:MAG: hypothetical protein L3J00_00300 [Thiomicrorhabdus sp.]|nr:hypothetical protein [Thiomicrorhabdus sp.]